MSMSVRRLGGAFLMLFACASVSAQSTRTDDLVLRNGFLSLDYGGSDAGAGNTGLRLQALGSWSDARGNARFSLWRVRNANAMAKSVRVEAEGFTLEFSAKAHADSLLRSPVARTGATHRLYSGSSLVDSQVATGAAWIDATTVARTSGANRAPLVLSHAPTVAELDPDWRYAPIVDDPDRELVAFSVTGAPAGLAYDDATRAFVLHATSASLGASDLRIRAADARGGSAEECLTLRVVADFCPVYPLALPDALLASASTGQAFTNVPRGTGAGNFGLLTWAGSPNAPTLAASLAAPGDSYTYENPDAGNDHVIDAGDWLQGSPGNSNSSAVRGAMDALLGKDILLPTWSATRGQGNNFAYRNARFARTRISAYSFTGQGTLSFSFQGWATCYDDAPRAQDQAVRTERGTPVSVTLAATDPEARPLTFSVVAAPSHGSLTGTPPTLVYTPASGYVGADRFTFTASDGAQTSEIAIVDITVVGIPNRAPVANAQSLAGVEDAPTAIVLTATDADGDTLGYAVATPPAHGTLSGTAPNLVYLPAADFNGTDAFTFRANDGHLDSLPATVTLTIAPLNDAPVAADFDVATRRSVPVAVTLTGSDVDSSTLAFELGTPPAHGTLSGTPPALEYRPNTGYVGVDAFTYFANDGALRSQPATVTVTVADGNFPPVARPDAIATDEDTGVSVVLDGSDGDADALTFRVVAAPAHGSLAGTPPNLTYSPARDYHGADQFSFVASDGRVDSAPAVVSIAVSAVNDAPVATAGSASVDEDASVTIVLAGTDVDGDAMIFRIVGQPSHGTLELAGVQALYRPRADFNGVDEFTFVANDGDLDSVAPARVSIAVRAVADAPTADPASASLDEDGEVAIYLSASDPDGGELAFRVAAAPAHGTVSIAGARAMYRPAADYNGADTFTFTASDGARTSVPASVTLAIAAVNDAPRYTSTPPAGAVTAGTHFTYDADAIDVDGDAVQFTLVASPSGATVNANTGLVDWLASGSGTKHFELEVSDGQGARATQSFDVSVAGENHAPRITSTPPVVATEGTVYRYPVTTTDPDVGDVVGVALRVAPPGMQVAGNEVTWTPSSANPIGAAVLNPACVTTTSGTTTDVADAAEVIVLMDESGSMQGDQAWMRLFLPSLHYRLQQFGVGVHGQPNRYGLIGFGRNAGDTIYYRYPDDSYLSPDPWAWYTLTRQLVALGEWEDAYEGIVGLTTRYPLREGAARNVILVTDDARTASRPLGPPSPITYAQTLAALRDNHIKLNAVLDEVKLFCGDGRRSMGIDSRGNGYVPDGAGGYTPCTGAVDGTTWLGMKEQVTLALSSGGAVWDLQYLRDGGPNARALNDLLLDIKTREIAEPSRTALSDLAITDVRAAGDAPAIAAVTVTVTNRGGAPAASGARVELLDVARAAVIGSTGIPDALAAGGQALLAVAIATPVDAGTSLQARIVSTSPALDCNLLDDTADAAIARIEATDLAGASATQAWAVAVRERNDPPLLDAIADQQVVAGELLTVSLHGSDPDRGDAVRYELVSGLPGAWLDGISGTLRFRPAAWLVGPRNLVVRVRDVSDATAERTIHVTVLPAPGPASLAITTTPPARTLINTTYTYTVRTDADASQQLQFRLTQGPAGASIDAATGVLTWAVPTAALGQKPPFIVAVNDQYGNVDAQDFFVEVEQPNVAPVITRGYGTAMQTESRYTGNAQVSDANPFDVLTWTMLKSPAGATINPASSGVTWIAPDPAPATGWVNGELVQDFMCRQPGTRLEELRLKIKRTIAGRGWSVPAVGRIRDANGDGRIDAADPMSLVVADSFLNRVVALDPATGATQFVATPVANLSSDVTPAIADLDADGVPEILVHGGTASVRTLVALRNDGTLAWQAATPPPGNVVQRSAIRTADLDGDGRTEILLGAAAYDAAGARIATFGARNVGNVELVDIDGDGRMEVGQGGALYRADGTLLWNYAHGKPHVEMSVGNFDADPAPEFIVHAGNYASVFAAPTTALLDTDGTVRWTSTLGSFSGEPVVADLDGDGGNDVYLTTASLALDGTGALLWDSPGGNTANQALAGDLNGDGAIELVEYGNASVMHARVGTTGQRLDVLTTSSSSTGASTPNAAPIPVDLDGDGSPELVFGGPDALTIVTTAGAPLNAGPPIVPSIVAPDLWIGVPILRIEPQRTLVDVSVANRGMRSVTSPFRVSLRNGSPNRDGGELGTSTVAALRAGASSTLTFTLGEFESVPAEIYARVDADGAVVECEERNNTTLTALFRTRVTDTGSLFDEARFAVGATLGSDTPRIVSVAPTAAKELSRYTYAVRLRDPGVSADYRYRLVSGPAGMDVHPNTGVVTWVPPSGSQGNVPVTLSVSDLRGITDTQSFTIVVGPATNHAPTFTSTPVATARLGVQYRYDADATDADSDAIAYSLAQGPAGMQVDTSSGLVIWSPTAAQIGAHAIAIRATDAQGAATTQSWSLVVQGANTGPTITSAPTHTAKVAREYRYDVVAVDPDGDALRFTLQQGPAGMAIDAQGRLRWTPASAGAFPVVVRVDDTFAYADQSWTITVLAADVALIADVIATPHVVAQDAPVTITLFESGAAGPVTRTVTVDGNPIALDAAGQATVQSAAVGRHVVEASINDGFDTATDSDEFFVADPSDTEAPVVQLHAPDDNDEVTSPRDIVGTVTDAHLASWLLAVRPANSPNATPTILARGTANVNAAVLAQFDPTLLLNGQYALILQGTDQSGQTTSDSAVLRVTGDMKVGQFSITFEDIAIPVAGIPVRVTRTYDSRQRNESLDFGNGWSVDYQNVRVRESAKPGFSWRTYQPVPGPFGEWCTQSNGRRVVTVTLPDGQVESFRAKAVPECTPLVPETNVTLQFEPIDGTDSTLTQQDYGLLQVATIAGSGVYNVVDPGDPSVPVDPRHYRLTTPEGVVYDLDQSFGVTKITEPNGNTLTYSRDGVRHSTGVGVDFVRDPQGRITKMRLPDGNELVYSYDANGDLRAFADQLLQTSRYEYNKAAFPHYLTDLIDPRGITVARNEYDDDGRLVATIDADGHRIEYTHDVAGRREQIRDRLGRLQSFVYDDNGWVLSETNALGESTSHTYDDDGNELTRTDDLGHVTTWTYDVRGNRLSERNALGEVTTSTYDTRNNLLTQVDALGHTVIASTYDSRGATLTEMRDALGHVTRFGYDIGIGSNQSGELKSMTDALGHVTSYDIDYRGWRYGETDALGHHAAYTHDDMGRVRTETRTRTVGAAPVAGDKSGSAPKAVETLVTTTTYDNKGRVTRVENPDGTYSTMEYNAIDKPVRECDRANRCTEHEYNARGEETVTRYPDGTSESKTYDANGNVLTQTDRGGRVTTMVYDEAGRLVETIMPDDDTNPANNPRTQNGYDGAGRLVSTTDANGNVTRYEYDDAGRRTKVILPATATAPPAEMLTGYDAAGRRTSSTDALGNSTTYVYDAAGRMTDTVFADGKRAKVEYDALGRKTAEIDPDNRRTEYGYDALGRLTAVTLAAGTSEATVTTYGYDELGNRTTQTDAEGRTTRFSHDSAGRELSRTLPMGQAETKAYDTLGRLASQTDFTGKTTNWLYDTVDRVTRIDYPNDVDATFTYTPSGQRETATNGTGTQTSGFDAQDRVVLRRDAAGRAIEYRYDSGGNLVSRISPNQSLVYTYDARNRMTRVTATVTGQPPRTTTYEYDQSGNRTAMVGADGVRTEYGYDSRYRLINLAKRTAASALLFAASYTVDDSGMRTAIAETDASGPLRTVAYQYDGLKRLTQEAITHREASQTRTSAWTYDKVGNRLTQRVEVGASAQPVVTAYDYDANDRLLTETIDGATTTYAYDANGNTTGRTRPGLLTEYAYDDANRLKEMREAGDRTTYAYDPDGLRIAQTTVPATGPVLTTEYLRDGEYAYSQVVEEYTRTNGALAQLEAVLTFGDDLIAQTRFVGTGGTTHNVHADGFGSTRFLTDSSSSVTDERVYDAIGNEIYHSGTTEIDLLYRSEQFDFLLDAYYVRARYLDPKLGRFTQQDAFQGLPLRPSSLNKYAYVEGDPVNGADPSGLLRLDERAIAASVESIIQRTIAAGAAKLGWRVIVKVAIASAVVIAIAANEISGNPGRRELPTIWFGVADSGAAAAHYSRAIGERQLPSVLTYTRSSAARPQWYRYKPECKGKATTALKTECDEYPFGKTREGGPSNYEAGRVSLKAIPEGDNGLAGTRFSQFLGACGVPPDSGLLSKFKVGTSQGMTRWDCGGARW